ncbi:uncharacterized protein LOC126656894 [Mercurialis annua]|uniref:uncharacterized protein LOC126656894 n=1 Tax=Mercurialis annua TaxID=3986 RepID=UPI00215F4EFC|nr:uncharacterized protein LOC126656894 [Mercurialis annua]
MKRLNVHFVKNDTKRIRAACHVGCPWRFLASIDGRTESLMVKTYIPEHMCYITNTNRMATSKFLAKHLRNRLISQPTIKLEDLKALFRAELKLKVSKTMCQNIKKRLYQDSETVTMEEYRCLFDYGEELGLSNPGTTCIIRGTREDGIEVNRFKRMYVCLAACKQEWMACCRKIIGMDGCFLKGLCIGQLMCAIGRDGNNQMFPIAWAVVQVENHDNWGWFIRLLAYDLQLQRGDGLVIISDMQKAVNNIPHCSSFQGLESAIHNQLPLVEHRRCARHVYDALAKRWKGEDMKLGFWTCAKSTFEQQLRHNLNKLELMGVGMAKRYNNLAETFNGWILDARCLPKISMLEAIRVQVMTRLHVKRVACMTWINDIGPRAMKQLEKSKNMSNDWVTLGNGDHSYEVTSVASRDPEDYVHDWYKVGKYKEAYQYMLQPVRGKIMWPESGLDPLEPPLYRRMPSRPKRARRRDKHETKKVGPIGRQGWVMRCKICCQLGHNSRGCPNRDPTLPTRPAKPRKKANGASTSQVVRRSAQLVAEFGTTRKRKRSSARVLPDAPVVEAHVAPAGNEAHGAPPGQEAHGAPAQEAQAAPPQEEHDAALLFADNAAPLEEEHDGPLEEEHVAPEDQMHAAPEDKMHEAPKEVQHEVIDFTQPEGMDLT